MIAWSEVVVKGLDSFVKVDLLRYLCFMRGVPVAPRRIAEDIGRTVAEVTRALGDFIALGILVPCWSDGIPRYMLTPQARDATEDLLDAWAGVQPACYGPSGANPDTDAA